MFTDINRIAELAKEDPNRQFSSIAHLITGEKLYEAFRSLRKNASAGIDGVTYQQYETNAEENIRQLHQRLKEGKYRAQPLRRVYIPKEDGKQRPISIPVLEDKIVQKAVVDLLNAIYEQDFLDCAYGFRPKRGQHQALDEVGRIICTRPIGWILEIDIRSYFDSIVRSALVEMIEKRVIDGSVLRLIGKWIKGSHRGRQTTRERNRYRTGATHQSAPGQYIPALHSRRMVRERSEAPAKRGSLRDPLC